MSSYSFKQLNIYAPFTIGFFVELDTKDELKSLPNDMLKIKSILSKAIKEQIN